MILYVGTIRKRLRKTLTMKQAAIILVFCMLISASFALGAFMGRKSMSANVTSVEEPAPSGSDAGAFGQRPSRGTVGAIDQIEGDVIRLREPRSGRTLRVRARDNTIIEFGRHHRIPFDKLRVGQRIFVIGMPDRLEPAEEFDAQFIGVLLGQSQRYIKPVKEPMMCWDCAD